MADERRAIEDKRYAVVSRDTIRMFAETVGYSDIPDDVSSMLSEDVTYRLRELIQHSCHFLRHGRRKKLTTEDVNKALRNSDTSPILGHGTQEMLPFRQTKEAELYFVDDLDINLPNFSYGNQAVPQVGKPSVKAYWLAVEGVQKPGCIPQSLELKPLTRTTPTVNDDMLQYYDNVTKAILGNEEEITKLALVDLRTNTKISPLMPYFVNFFANGVKTVNHDVVQLMKLLHMVRSLISNKSLNLEPIPYLDMLVQSILYCVVDPLAASINPQNDHWKLRDYAARLLAIVTRDWESPLNRLRDQSLAAFQEVLYDISRPFCSHYGAVIGLLGFGTQAVEDILLPQLHNFWCHLQASMDDNTVGSTRVKSDAHKVYGAILLASEYVLKARVSKLLNETDSDVVESQITQGVESKLSSPAPPDLTQEEPQTACTIPTTVADTAGGTTRPMVQVMESGDDLIGPILQLPETTNPDPHRDLAQVYRDLAEYFGDSLSAKWPVNHFMEGVYTVPSKVTAPSGLGLEAVQSKSGEEMLQEFISAAAAEEKLKKDSQVSDSQHKVDQPPRVDRPPDEYSLSDKSSRSLSSRASGRSMSDENLSYLGEEEEEEDADLTVKATVSDPSQGIKLTILKRPKLKLSELMMEGDDDEEEEVNLLPKMEDDDDDDDDEMPVLEPKPEPLKLHDVLVTEPRRRPQHHVTDVFDLEPMIQNDVMFVFRILGCEQVCNAKRNSKREGIGQLLQPKSEVKLLSHLYKIYGKRKFTSLTKKTKRKYPSFFNTGNIDCFL